MFSSGQRNGIFVLLFFIVLLQVLILNFNQIHSFLFQSNRNKSQVDEKWLVYQEKIDSVKKDKSEKTFELKPFNPNYINDYKGYMLGMSVQEIDRLHTFRKQGKFVNSISDFKKVTQVSDSLLNKIAPYFKFPDWITSSSNTKRENHQFFENKKIIKKNVNLASKAELMEVYGIGDKLSDIILKDKLKFGEFASIEQLRFVWGITPETYENIQKHFFVELTNSGIKKIKINEASTKELSSFPYFNYKLAKEIVTSRSMNGSFKSTEELTKIKDFPIEKIEIIVLYLDFN